MKNLLLITLSALTIFSASAASLKTISPADAAVVPTLTDPRNSKKFKQIFKLMLEEENYPFIVHCYAGQDRTGTLTYVLLALLGVNDDDLSLDWEATGFWNRGPHFNHKGFYDNIPKSFIRHGKGTTTLERAENYVRKVGFTDEDIAKFRKLMLEP